MTFTGMYRLVHDINKRLSDTNFRRVEVGKEFFKDLEKVFDEVAGEMAFEYIMDEMKKDDG